METPAAVQDQQQVPRSEPLRDDNPILLPLDLAERGVCWRNREGRVRTHVFRRVTQRDWDGYFTRMVFEADQNSRTIDVNSAALWLYSECILRAEGYAVKGGADLATLANWQRRIPPGHRLQAVGLLAKVERSGEGAEMEPEIETVSLDAFWGLGEGGTTMRNFTGLVHRFNAPSAEQMVRYSRETSRSRIVGGSAIGRTIYAVRQKILLKLYDELVVSVDGYGVGGKAIDGREAIAREMDAFHKIAAAGVLFSTAAEEEADSSTEPESE